MKTLTATVYFYKVVRDIYTELDKERFIENQDVMSSQEYFECCKKFNDIKQLSKR